MNIVAPRTLDQKVWLDWLAKNRKQEHAFHARMVKFAMILLPIAAVVVYFTLLR